MLDEKQFEPLFGDWWELIRPLFVTGQMDEVYKQLRIDRRRDRISPLPMDVFKAFEKCSLKELKCVFIGLSPYASFYNNLPVADGLAFSCGITKREQPSLELMWDAAFDNFKVNKKEAVRYTDLTHWAKQGVLLINVALTAKERRPDSHVKLWKPFMQYLFEEVLQTVTGIPIVYFGEEAAEMERHSLPFGHYNRVVEHPAFAHRQNRAFEHKKLFSWANLILTENGKSPVKWVCSPLEHKEIMGRISLVKPA